MEPLWARNPGAARKPAPGREAPPLYWGSGGPTSVDDAGEVEQTQTAKVWHDNETSLANDAKYQASKLTSVRFPPNSGDLNPIETVWS